MADGVSFPYAMMGTDELTYESTSLDESLANYGPSDEDQAQLSLSIDALEMVNAELYRRAVWAEKAVELRDLALDEKDPVLKDAYATNARYFAGPHCRYEGLCVDCFLAGDTYATHADCPVRAGKGSFAAAVNDLRKGAFTKLFMAASGAAVDGAAAEEDLWEHLLATADADDEEEWPEGNGPPYTPDRYTEAELRALGIA